MHLPLYLQYIWKKIIVYFKLYIFGQADGETLSLPVACILVHSI